MNYHQARFRGIFPALLLGGTGTLLGITVVLSRAAVSAGIPAVAFSFWQALIGGTIILLVGVLRGARPGLTPRHFRYYAITGLCSIGLPNTLLFLSVPHVGAGHASIAYALPPLLTYLIALAVRVEAPQTLRMAGLALGAIGAAILASLRGTDLAPEQYGWMALVLIAPITAAIANIYRTLDWPKAATPEMLAGGMLISAAIWIAPVMIVAGDAHLPTAAGWSVYAAGVISAGGFVMSFALQRMAGPVTFSQLGYIVIAVSMGLGAVFFDERFSPSTLFALAILLSGLFLTTSVRPQARPSSGQPERGPLPRGSLGGD